MARLPADGFSWHVAPPPTPIWRRPAILFFAAAVLLFLLQLPPVPGVYLMFFGAGIVAGLCVVLGFASIGYEVWRGTLPRFWLAVPAAALLGYYGCVLVQHLELQGRAAEWSAGNHVALLGDKPLPPIAFSQGHGYLAHTLLAHYQLDEAYVVENPREIRLLRRTDGPCPAGSDELSLVRSDTRTRIPFCVFAVSALPADAVLFDTHLEWESWWGGGIQRAIYSATQHDTTLGTYSWVVARTFGWSPVPLFLGCSLVSSRGGGWQCGFGSLPNEVTVPANPAGYEDRFGPAAWLLGLARR